MDDFKIDLSPLDNLFNTEDLAEKMLPDVKRAMEAAKGSIQRLLPDGATGNLRRAPIATSEKTTQGLEGRVYIPEENPAVKYAKVVEFGRSAGTMPPWSKPTDPLYLWAKRKLGNAHYKTTGKVKRFKAEDENGADREVKSFAFLVARKIQRTGTKAQHPFELGWTKSENQVQTIISYAFEKAILGK